MDVLGYKEYIKNHSDELDTTIVAFKKLIETVKEMCANTFYAEDENVIKYKFFSDNILLYLEVDSNRTSHDIQNVVSYMIEVVTMIQYGILVQFKLLSRGSIVKGLFFADDDFVFGPAIIEAYEIESRNKYPYVVISNDCWNFFLKTFDDCGYDWNYGISDGSCSEHRLCFLDRLCKFPRVFISSNRAIVLNHRKFTPADDLDDYSDDEIIVYSVLEIIGKSLRDIVDHTDYDSMPDELRSSVEIKQIWAIRNYNNQCESNGLDYWTIDLGEQITKESIMQNVSQTDK